MRCIIADTKLSALTALTGANVDTAVDTLLIDDVSVTTNKKIIVSELATAFSASQTEQEAASSTSKFVSPGTQKFHPTAAKAWLVWALDGSVTGSYNISSVTDTGTGDFTVSFTVAFSSGIYSAVISASDRNPPVIVGWDTNLVGNIRVTSRDVTGALTDSSGHYCAAFFGDQ